MLCLAIPGRGTVLSCRPRTRLTWALLFVLLPGVTVRGQSQDPKRDFTSALGRVTAALEGRFGDDSGRVAEGLGALDRALAAWDQAIGRSDASLATALAAAAPADAVRLRIASALTYAERGRLDDAFKALDAALALSPRDVDAHTVLGLLHAQFTANTRAAASAFRVAVGAAPAAPLQRYLLAKQLADQGNLDEAALVAGPVRSDTRDPAAPDRAPFMRIHLIPEVPGIEPYFPASRYLAAFVALGQGRYSEAVTALRAAATADPLASPPAAIAPMLARAGTALRDGDVDAALAALDQALTTAPAFADTHRLRGIVLASADRTDNAAEEFRAALQASRADERTHLALADVLAQQEQYEAAAEALRAAIVSVPASPRLHHALGRVLQRLGSYPEAVAEFERALAQAPPLPLLGLNTVQGTIATLRRAQQEFPEATAAFARRVDLVPNNVEAHRELGDIYFRQGLDDLAWTEFAIAEALAPRDVATQAALAQLHLRAGRHAEAVASARRVIALESNHAQAHYVLGTALLRTGQDAEGGRALDTFRRLDMAEAGLRQTQLELNALRREAVVAAAQGDLAKAVSLFEQIVAKDARSAAAHVDLGAALLKEGRAAEAIERLQTSAGLGASEAVYRLLTEAYEATGDTEQSRRAREVHARIARERLRQAGRQ